MDDRLRQLESRLDKLNNIERDVERHEEAIYGNGVPGLKTRMELQERSLSSLIKDLEKRANKEWYLLGGIGLLIAQNIVTALIKILQV